MCDSVLSAMTKVASSVLITLSHFVCMNSQKLYFVI